jgi:hypothetical protein
MITPSTVCHALGQSLHLSSGDGRSRAGRVVPRQQSHDSCREVAACEQPEPFPVTHESAAQRAENYGL